MSESSTHKQSWGILAALIVICMTFLYYTGIENYSKTPKWIGQLSLVIVLFIVQRRQGLRWSWALTIWSVFILQYLLQAAASYNTFDALANSIPLFLGPLLVLGLFRSNDLSNQFTQLSVLLAIITCPLILYGFYELADLASSSDFTRANSYQIRFSFGHKNQLSQFFTLLIPLYALGILTVKEKWKKALFTASIIGIFIFVTLLMNRTSLILLYGIYPLALLVYLIHAKLRDQRKKIAYGALTGISVLTILLIISIPDKIPLVGTWLASESGNERLMIWQNSLELVKESPIIGHGSGDWKIEILRTSLARTGVEHQLFFQRAHNEFIHTLVENGIVGFLILISFFVYSIFRIIRSSIGFNFKLMSITGLSGFLIISNLSFPLERVELVFLLFLFLVPTYSYRAPSKTRQFSLIGISAICLLFALSWIKQERNFVLFKQDNNLELADELSTFTLDATSTPVAFYEGNYYFSQQNYENAAASFEEADRRNPYHVHILNNLASSQSLLGEIDAAKETYKRLFQLDASFSEGLINAASVHFNSGDISQALDYLLKVPVSKEPDNFALFVNAILGAQLQEMKSTKGTTQSQIERIDEVLKSEENLIALFREIQTGKSVSDSLSKR